MIQYVLILLKKKARQRNAKTPRLPFLATMLNGRSDVFLAKLVARGDLEKNVLARQPRDDLINGKKIKRKGKGKGKGDREEDQGQVKETKARDRRDTGCRTGRSQGQAGMDGNRAGHDQGEAREEG